MTQLQHNEFEVAARQLQRNAEGVASPVIAVAAGDGIGPEIMNATLRILAEAGSRLDLRPVEVGESVYRSGHTSGIAPESWDILNETGLLLKAPITTPSGGGYKSLNVSLRKTFGLFANVRPCRAYAPAVATRHPQMDLVIIRENEEDTYAGIEHRQTAEVTQCLKLISQPGSQRLCRFAFEYARAQGRPNVACFIKDNIMKLTDGLFYDAFEQVGAGYDGVARQRFIIDIGTALLADQPERFDVIVAPNLYGDILSDVAAQLTGSVGLGGSANLGEGFAMFEAVHGSAPDIAGQDKANPSGLLQAAIMLLSYVGQDDVALRVEKAWLKTLEDGVRTGDLRGEAEGAPPVGTQAFADAVIERLGQEPQTMALSRGLRGLKPIESQPAQAKQRPYKETVGVDVFLDWDTAQRNPDVLAERLLRVAGDGLVLKLITNRGVKVWPNGNPRTFCTDHWRCRFVSEQKDGSIRHGQIVRLLQRLNEAGVDFIKTENLCTFDGERGYSLGQGE
ncbi:MAG: NADP-dependent isocitrate dehydrogenase [Opitutales bacterium]